MPALRAPIYGTDAHGIGAGLAVRPVHRGAGGVSALLPRHRLRAALGPAGRRVRRDHQRRRARQPVAFQESTPLQPFQSGDDQRKIC